MSQLLKECQEELHQISSLLQKLDASIKEQKERTAPQQPAHKPALGANTPPRKPHRSEHSSPAVHVGDKVSFNNGETATVMFVPTIAKPNYGWHVLKRDATGDELSLRRKDFVVIDIRQADNSEQAEAAGATQIQPATIQTVPQEEKNVF